MIRLRVNIALLTSLVFCSVALGATSAPERDADIQARIAAVVTAMEEQPGTVEQRVQDLQRSADGRREALLVQLALFLGDSDSTEKAMVGALLVQALEFTSEEKLAAVLPYLEAESASLRKVLEEILGTIDRPDGAAPDFAFYEQALEQLGREPAAALIRYMYRVAPATALASMQRVFSGGATAPSTAADVDAVEALIAKHDGLSAWSDGDRVAAGEALARLARDPFWPVRLYVAGTLGREPDLDTAALRARLAADQDALVRSVARQTTSSR